VEERSGREYEDFAREEEDLGEPKKGSAIPALITIIIVLLLGAGGYFAYITFIKGGQKAAIAPSAVSQPQEQIPEVSQPAASGAEQPAAPSAAVPPVAEPGASASAAASQKVQTPPSATAKAVEETVEKPARKDKIKSLTKKEKAAAFASPEPARKPAREESSGTSAGKITITSNPSGASVKVDDKVIGVTPYVWNKPGVYGEVMITLSKSGYKDGVKTIEFTGTNVSEWFKLEKEEAPVIAKPAPSAAPKAPEPEPSVAEEPPAPPPPKPAPAPRAVAPAPAPEEPAEAPAPAPAPRAAAASAEPATVFIASIPPVADVYMDGKLIGKTNISKLNVTAGAHSMRFVKGTQDVSKDMTFKSGDNPSQLVNLK
jgi:hypothetical protein